MLYVALFVEVGLLLLILPWSAFWERNYFAYAWPALRPLLTNNFVRGAVSGLGFVNLVAALLELIPLLAVREPRDVPFGPDTQVEP